MGLFPSHVNSTEEALNYLAGANQSSGVVSITGATATLTPAQAIGGLIVASTGSTLALTYPSAASVVAAIPQCEVGQRFEMKVINNNSGTLTLTAGTGNTIAGTATIATTKAQIVIGVVTNATAGAEAVTYYSFLNAAS